MFCPEFEGHGRSEGHPRSYFKSLDDLASDCYDFSVFIQERSAFSTLRTFIYGESMGGTIAVKLAL